MKSDRLFHTESDWKIFLKRRSSVAGPQPDTRSCFCYFFSLAKKKRTQKTHHEIIYSYILSVSLSWTVWQVNRGENTTVYLHIYTTIDLFPWCTAAPKHTITHIYTLKLIIQRKMIIIYSPSMSFQNYMTLLWSTKEYVEQNVNAALCTVEMHVNGGFRAPKTTL